VFEYNTLVVVAGTALLGIVSGIIGSLAVLRGRALLGDAVAHAALPGICGMFLLTGVRSLPLFLLGALLSGWVGIAVITILRQGTRIKDDAAIGIVLSVFFGLGIALSRIAQNAGTGNKAGLDTYIYGKAAGMLFQDVLTITAVAAGVLLVMVLLYKEFTLLSFDREFAGVQGWPVARLDSLLMGMLVLTAVIGLPAVGVLLMAAMLILPGAAARFWTDRLSVLLWLAGAFGGAAGVAGSLISAHYARLPAGPVIVLCGACVFGVSLLAAPRRGVVSRAIHHLRMRRRVAWQNFLRRMFELAELSPEELPVFTPADLVRRASARGHSTGRAAMLHRGAGGGRAAEGGAGDTARPPGDGPAQHAARRLLRRAERLGLVDSTGEHAYRMTTTGVQTAAEQVRRHRLWEMFLIHEAQIAADHVDRDADEFEHILPVDLQQRLERLLVAAGRWPKGAALPPPSPHALDPAAGGV
jgi:manganese/zinc/iron transport system permease protein